MVPGYTTLTNDPPRSQMPTWRVTSILAVPCRCLAITMLRAALSAVGVRVDAGYCLHQSNRPSAGSRLHHVHWHPRDHGTIWFLPVCWTRGGSWKHACCCLANHLDHRYRSDQQDGLFFTTIWRGITSGSIWEKLNFQAGAPIRSLNAERPDLAGEVSNLFATPSLVSFSALLLSD